MPRSLVDGHAGFSFFAGAHVLNLVLNLLNLVLNLVCTKFSTKYLALNLAYPGTSTY